MDCAQLTLDVKAAARFSVPLKVSAELFHFGSRELRAGLYDRSLLPENLFIRDASLFDHVFSLFRSRVLPQSPLRSFAFPLTLAVDG